MAKYGENDYKVELPPNLSISLVFNIQDLIAFKGDISKTPIDVH